MTKIYIYAATEYGKKLYGKMQEDGFDVIAIIDKNAEKLQKEQFKCISIEEAINEGAKEAVIIVTNTMFLPVVKELKENGFKRIYRLSDLTKYGTDGEISNDYFLPTDGFYNVRPFNHYESPYADYGFLKKYYGELAEKEKEVYGIDFREDKQLQLIEEMSKIELLDWKDEITEKYRYYYTNGWFGRDGAKALYLMMRVFSPKKIIEIGSGYSTAVMLDTNEYCLNNSVSIYCIEPRPYRINEMKKKTDNICVYETDVQNIEIEKFLELEENDILFIDSSHVCKVGSDVSMEILEILPRLKKGVIVHFHDIHWPMEYPYRWIVEEGRAYNEMFVLRAFLTNNDAFEILLFGEQLLKQGYDVPDNMKGCGLGSLWIRKTI